MKQLRIIDKKIISNPSDSSDFGVCRLKLKEYLDANDIPRNALGNAIGIKFQTIDRYYQGDEVARADLKLLAKICYALDCKLEDIIEYQPPTSSF